MGLTSKKEEQLRRMPLIRTQVFKSKSGKLLVHRTVITDIKPIEYYQKVFDSPGTEEVQEVRIEEAD
jgi:hypothetical protein